MPQLDAMLRALAERGVRELRLAENARPAFVFPDGERPVSQSVLTRRQIVTLVQELATPEDAARLSAGGPVRFSYRQSDESRFICDVGAGGGSFIARVIREPSPSAGLDAAVEPAPSAAMRPSLSEARPAMLGIEDYLAHLVEAGASDLHLSSGEPPMLRLHGEIVRVRGAGTLSPEETARLLYPMMPARYKQEFEETGDTDFAHEVTDLARFRCNVFTDRKGVGAVLRVISKRIPTVQDLGLPKAVVELCLLRKGLVLITGPTGSGKSTTLASLIDHLNRTRTDHIITLEDPIEFVHESRGCLVNQREVGTHTKGFKKALRAALREDPDIVLVGEMRDLDTVAVAIETAETGHLVFGTLHTSTAASTVDRIVDQFPSDRQSQIRVMLAESLKGIVSQTLVKKKGGGRVAAMEVLIGIPAISNLIREGKTFQIPSVMQTGRKHGMTLMNDALADLVKRGVVDAADAVLAATDKAGVSAALRGAGIEVAPVSA